MGGCFGCARFDIYKNEGGGKGWVALRGIECWAWDGDEDEVR